MFKSYTTLNFNVFFGGRWQINMRFLRKKLTNIHASCIESLPIVNKPTNHSYWHVEHPKKTVKRDKRAQSHASIKHKPSAKSYCYKLQCKTHAVKPWHVFLRIFCKRNIAIKVVFVAFIEFLSFERFAHKSFYNAIAFNVFFYH